MRVFFVSMFLCLLTVFANAATFCAKPDKIVLGADFASSKATGGASAGFDWSINLENIGVVRGVSSCSTLRPNQDVDVNNCRKMWGQSYDSDLNTNWGHVAASNGDVNDNYYGRDDGNNCWCKMTRPFESGWVYIHNYNKDCKTTCATSCAEFMTSGASWYGGTVFPCMLATVGLND